MRIGRIGADHIQVAIRPAFGDDELLALVVRLEQLLDAGYGAIDVVFEEGLDAAAFPEAWREQGPGAAGDHYIAVKKDADIALSPAQPHEHVTRQDVTDTMALLHELGKTRQLAEVDHEDTPIAEVVQANGRRR